MSKINKLAIQGIRSFDPGHAEKIKFETPLTLIVGLNGSGKTTIIECLKYATTGQLPPNSKGGAFIHDPSIDNVPEVLGAVMLEFRNANGSKLVATRRISLTRKRTTSTFKTLEAGLYEENDAGERSYFSKQLMELNKSLQENLGVSEAVLDSVIFCHQDESLWPMSEPSVLKKRFDEIFEAGKYTKAIEKIRKMGKDHKVELAKHKITEDYTKTDKERAQRSETRQSDLAAEIEKLHKEATKLTEKKKKVREAFMIKQEESREVSEIISELKQKIRLQQDRQDNINELERNLTVLDETDQVLEARLAQSEARKGQFDAEFARFQKQHDQLFEEERKCRKKLDEKVALQGLYMHEKDSYEGQLETRVKLIRTAATSHRIRGYEGSIEDYHIQQFLDKLEKASREKKRELQRVIQDNSEAFGRANSEVTEIVKRKSLREQDKDNAKSSLSRNEIKIKNLENDMERIKVDEGNKSTLDADCDEMEARLKEAQSEFSGKEWESNISKEEARLRGLEEEAEKLSDVRTSILKNDQDRAEVTLREKELKAEQRELKTLTTTYGARITAAVGADWKPENLDQEFKAVVETRSKAVTDAQRLRDGTNTELATINYKLNTDRDHLQKSITEQTSCEKRVLESVEDLSSIDDFEAALKGHEDDRTILKADLENFGYAAKFYQGCLDEVQAKGKCKLCDRHFSDEQEKSAAIKKIQKKILKNHQETLEDELKVVEDAVAKAQAARPQYDTFRRLSAEIPALRKDIQQGETKRDEVLARLERQDLVVEEAEASKNDLESLRNHVTSIVQHASRISTLSQLVDRLASQQNHPGSRSLDEVEEQLQVVTEKKKTISKNVNNMRSEKERAITQINNTERSLNKSKSDRDKVASELEKKNGLALQVQTFKNENDQLRATIKQATKDLEELGPQSKTAKQELDAVRKASDAKEKKVRDEDSDLSMTNDKLQIVDSAIKKYVAEGGPDKLPKCQEEIKATEQELQHFVDEKSRVAKAQRQIENEKNQGEAGDRCIKDNLAYRRSKRSLEELAIEIQRLESKNAEHDARRLEEESAALDLEAQALNARREQAVGQTIAKDAELEREMEKWKKEFKDAAKKYRAAHINVETTKAAIEDLGKYGTALDQAIMKYHSLKMEEINRIAGELWQSTYQGTDIDTILIRSDNENTKGNRNYNYRVCMIKQDSEMDMRGRCSAGQRVLASIIIRLALAECFGVNCGIIALDEPTTNLDSDNIRSLAKSLHDIIEVRKAQKNFQLIVITHDEEFLKEMRCGSFVDGYWRVERNAGQKSVIKSQGIKDILG